MSKVTFVGDPNSKEPVADCVQWGIKFPAGKAVDVTDEAILAKMRNNSHFEIKRGRPAKEDSDGNAK